MPRGFRSSRLIRVLSLIGLAVAAASSRASVSRRAARALLSGGKIDGEAHRRGDQEVDDKDDHVFAAVRQ